MKKRVCVVLSGILIGTILFGCEGQNINNGSESSQTENAGQEGQSKNDLKDKINDKLDGLSNSNLDKDSTSEKSTGVTNEKSDDDSYIVEVVEHNLSCKGDDDKEVATGKYPEIKLLDDYKSEYPKLAETIELQNERWKSDAESTVSNFGYSFIVDDFGFDDPYCSEVTAEVVRIDDDIFSVIQSYYSFAGGAHPAHGSYSIHLDPVRGSTITLQNVLKDVEGAPDIIRNAVFKEYPDMKETIEEYGSWNDYEDEKMSDPFYRMLAEDTYCFELNEEGLYINFSPYQIAPYAAGYLEVTLPYDEYPDLVQPAYVYKEKKDLSKLVKKTEADTVYTKPEERSWVSEITIPNKTWKSFCKAGLEDPYAKHITLKKIGEKRTDWLNTEAWDDEHGFDVARMPYSDRTYSYEPINPIEYDYMFNGLNIYDASSGDFLYSFDLQTLINGPDEAENYSSYYTQYLRWAKMYENTLYLSVGHNTYADTEPKSSYMIAIDPIAGEVLWRSEPLVSNAWNFQIVDDTIICGYGFTDEPDFIYLLDRFTGKQLDKIKVNSGPDQFEIVGDTLYVATYNTAYEFKINR